MSLAVRHIPVLLAKTAALAHGRARIVDGTVGAGGHLQAFVESGARVVAFDRDPDAISDLADRVDDAVSLHQLSFGSQEALAIIEAFQPDMVFLDLGVSSQQIDDPERGFTFRRGSRLDMRMERAGATAADVLNGMTEAELADVLHRYGDERRARRLAAEIIRRRATQPFAMSDELVNAVRAVLGSRAGPADFARIFQAIRIAVNDELQELSTSLPRMRDALVSEGILAVLTYHSGEDRIVKHQFREWGRDCICPAAQPVCTCRGRALGTVVTKSPIVPDADEVMTNPRARSAKMRIFRKVA